MLLPMATRRFFALHLALLLFAAWALPAYALAGGLPGAADNPLGQLPGDRQPEGPVEIALTGDWHITGEVSLVALDPALAERFGDIPPLRLGEAFSPGAAAVTQPVTIRTNGYRIIVEAGGSLTLEELNPQSSLTVTGSHPQGLFQVRDGGKLVLSQVLVSSSGPAVLLEAGGDYQWRNTNGKGYPEPAVSSQGNSLRALELSPSFAGVEPLRVYDNESWDDALPGRHLPALPVVCAVGGVREQEPRQLSVVWDTGSRAADLAARRDCVLTGRFVDGQGRTVEADFVPELPVRFLRRQPVEILETVWEGAGAGYWGELRFREPDEAQSVRLEVSEDGGASWAVLPVTFSPLEGVVHAGFSREDSVPRLYRIAVEGGPNAGASRAVALPSSLGVVRPPQSEENSGGMDGGSAGGADGGSGVDGGTQGDIGGNRGGGTALDSPDRELPSSSLPESAAAASQEPAGESLSGPRDAPEPSVPENVSGRQAPEESSPGPEAGASQPPSQAEQAGPASPEDDEAEAPAGSPTAGQMAAAAAGVLVCGGAGVIAGRMGPSSRPGRKGPGDR